ncbi:MAG TPA: class I SAM-dependent methyltransferase [Dehalococcoidia bacterium]|nr:class I SAM-dependent methyltransferase [Dehalococcoidia bacterium]
MIKQPSPTWYKEIWAAGNNIRPWVGDTKNEVDFITDVMELSGSERILDLACGFGRHAVELSRRGFSVVGVDITPEYILEAERMAFSEGLNSRFICTDIRDYSCFEEFDVVLNMSDGAIGYLEDDFENQKIFNIIASSLKKGGKHFMHIHNADHAELHFPQKNWQIDDDTLSLPEFRWDKQSRRMLSGGLGIEFGSVVYRPDDTDFRPHSTIRLYSLQEIEEIFNSRKMVIKKTFGKFDQTVPASHWEPELLVYSEKL